jgi:ribosomal protein L12E/L44/L45/RPP1/RPP2
MLNQQQNSIASSASSIAGGSVNSVAYSGQSVANVAPEPPANAQAAAHAQQVAALLAAQAQEQKERERDEAEVSLNASLVGSGARQKLQGNSFAPIVLHIFIP